MKRRSAWLVGALVLALTGCELYDRSLPDKTDAGPDAAADAATDATDGDPDADPAADAGAVDGG